MESIRLSIPKGLSIHRSCVATPFDVVKNRIQSGSAHYSSTAKGMISIIQKEGFFKLWRGLTFTAVANIPSTTFYYVGYDYLKNHLHDQLPQKYHHYSSIFAGSIARVIAVSFVAPLELYRTRLQASSIVDTSACMNFVSNSIVDYGVRNGKLFQSFFRGLSATLWRDVPFSGIYWYSYESSQPWIQSQLVHNKHLASFVAGCGSGTLAALLTHPFDVLKTVQQTSDSVASKSIATTFRSLMEQEGPAALLRGLGPRIAKVAPSCGVMIASYEVGKSLYAYVHGAPN